MRSALRMRVAAFTPIAPAIVWSSLAVLAGEHRPLDLLLRAHSLSLGPLGPPRGALVAAAVGTGTVVRPRRIGDPAGDYGTT